MSLRARLSLAFVVSALVPLGIAAFLIALVVPSQSQERAQAKADGSVRAAVAGLQATCARTALAAEQVAGRVATSGGLGAAAADVVRAGVATSVVVIDVDGTATVLAGPAPTVAAASLPDCADRLDSPAIAGRVTLSDGRAVVAVVPVDAALVQRLSVIAGTDVDILRAGAAPVSSGGAGVLAAVKSRVDDHPRGHADGAAYSALDATGGSGQGLTVLSTVATRSVFGLLFALGLVLVLAMIGVLLLASRVARALTRPLIELGAAARRVTGGNFRGSIPVHGSDEVAVLGSAFNDMTQELQVHIVELEGSRDELRGTLTRLGETLSSTHDLDRILAVILETAQTAIRARAGALFLHSGGRGDLYLAAARGLDRAVERPPVDGDMPDETLPPLRVGVGDGVIGRVFLSGEAMRGAVGVEPGQLRTTAEEPQAKDLIAVPLRASGRVTGVLGLYDRLDGGSFDSADLDTIRTFAAQAGVAIDNVLLHQEAQRLSITDGLTGLWNYRYLTMALAREVERAVRFGRPVAVLMLDLDRFKAINDAHGHQRGDSVLIEVATRVKREIREVDVLARYGGEELVCVLPETDLAGAEVIAQRIHHAIRANTFAGEGEQSIRVTISIGVAVYPQHGVSSVSLLGAADEALYTAKRDGRDCVRVAQEPPPRQPLRLAGPEEPQGIDSRDASAG